VITKSDAAHRALSELFSKHGIEREYWAFCYGAPKVRSGRIESLIGRNPKDRKKMSSNVREGRKAITHYQVLTEYFESAAHRASSASRPFASWVSARLETGRTHQVRVHLTDLGHSLLGDPVYGTPTRSQPKWKALPTSIREAVEKLPGQALHARVLGFTHPITGQPLRVEAPLPPALAELQQRLAAYGEQVITK
jgi:23S rRNA pseudouridine1911/1915/1917 synthase